VREFCSLWNDMTARIDLQTYSKEPHRVPRTPLSQHHSTTGLPTLRSRFPPLCSVSSHHPLSLYSVPSPEMTTIVIDAQGVIPRFEGCREVGEEHACEEKGPRVPIEYYRRSATNVRFRNRNAEYLRP
jgi:hypothetical protein